MGQKRHILLAALLVAVLGGLAWLVLRPGEGELVYQGKPLSFWIERYASDRSKVERQEAEIAVRHIGTNAIPTLLRMLQARDSALKLKLVALAKKHNLEFSYASAAGASQFLRG
jgi:hypothetical protein